MLKYFSFLIPNIKLNFDNFNNFYDTLQEETEIFIEELESYWLEGILNYTYDGCLDESICEQFLNEFDLDIDDYITETGNSDLSVGSGLCHIFVTVLQHHPHPLHFLEVGGTGRRSGTGTPPHHNFFLSIIFLTSFYYFSSWRISTIATAPIDN